MNLVGEALLQKGHASEAVPVLARAGEPATPPALTVVTLDVRRGGKTETVRVTRTVVRG